MPEKEPLTEIEKEIFYQIRKKIDKGIPPTIREICDSVECSSPATVNKYIDSLNSKGYIEKTSGHKRNIKLANYNSVNIPLVNCENYTENFLGAENILGFISWTPNIKHENPLFAVRLSENYKIFNSDDIAIAEKSDTADGSYYIKADNGKLHISDKYNEKCIGKIVSVIKYI